MSAPRELAGGQGGSAVAGGRTPREIVSMLVGSRALEHAVTQQTAAGTSGSTGSVQFTSPPPSSPSRAQPLSLQNELQHRFPTTNSRSYSRMAPYVPRRSYCRPTSISRRNSAATTPAAGASASSSGKVFYRDIVLLAKDDSLTVPRGARKARLWDEKRVANMVELNTQWSEEEMTSKIESVFGELISLEKPPPRFEYLNICGQTLKVPNVDVNFKWSGEKVKLITTSHRTLYVRSKFDLLQSPQRQTRLPQFSGCSSNSSNLIPLDDCGPGPGPGTSSQMSHYLHLPIPRIEIPPPPPSSPPTRAHGSQDIEEEIREADIHVLQEMFPDVRMEAIRNLRQRCSTNSVIDILVSEQEKKSKPASMCTLLGTLSKTMINEEDTHTLRVTRSCIFNAAEAFYKRAVHNISLLKKTLVIEYSGEDGVDAGALRNEFFEKAIERASQEFLEGNPTRRLPKNHWGSESKLEVLGAMVGHSLLQGGPGLPCIHPALVKSMISVNLAASCETLDPDELPRKDDIPLNAANEDLLEMIEKLDCCESLTLLDEIVDEDKYASLINSSGWDPTRIIGLRNVAELLQMLVYDEVVKKRYFSIRAFYNGLDKTGVGSLLKNNYDLMHKAFVHTAVRLTAAGFLSLISSRRPSNLPSHCQRAFDWFLQYIQEREECSYTDDSGVQVKAELPQILEFVTGLKSIPPLGLPEPINIEYLRPALSSPLPRANACFCQVRLPTIHDDKEVFFSKMDQGILQSLGHFGLM